MTLVPAFRFIAVVLFLVVGGSAAVTAQPGYPQRAPYGYAPQGYPPQQAYRDRRAYPPGYYPGKLIQPAQPQQGFSLRRFFGAQEEPAQPARKPVAKPRKPASAPVVARQEKPKPNPSKHVVVFGDNLADFARQGLDDIFAEHEDVAVVSKVRGDSSLVRSDPAEWPNSIRSALDEGQKISLAVLMLGVNDRHPLKEGEESFNFLSERWKELYTQRVDAILRTFQERAIPVVWVGLPPMKNSKISEDLLAMNEIFRESVERHGGTYVDIWPGFVDEDNRYMASGPDVSGEPARLRASDGVSFTKAGARKVAHFADTEIRRILGSGPTAPSIAAAPQPGEATPSIEAALPLPPDSAAPVSLPVKPLVGPVLPLTRPDVAPGGTLVSGAPKLNGDHAYPVQRALRAGIAPSSRPGRADDYRWPPTP